MHALPLILRGGRVLRTGSTSPEPLTISIGVDGRVAGLTEPGSEHAQGRVIELDGKLVAPGFVDAHQHLDKTRTLRAVANPEGTLAGAVAAFKQYAATMSREDFLDRAERTLEACLARGTVAIRTHANVDPELRVRGVEMLVELRERWKDRITLQVVAFGTAGATQMGTPAKEWLDEAIQSGADLIGGTPAISDQPEAFLDMLFDAAARHQLPIDLHLDEHLDATRQLFDAVIARTRRYEMGGRVAAGHCSALSAMAEDDARRVIDGMADAGIAVITLPTANLFLQGRDATRLPPRGLTRVKELISAGVRVAAATDNIQDPFVPVGTGDMLEIARWTLLAGHLSVTDLGTVFAMITKAPAEIMGIDAGIREGARADLVVTDAMDADDLVASGPPVRAVLVAGRLVAGKL